MDQEYAFALARQGDNEGAIEILTPLCEENDHPMVSEWWRQMALSHLELGHSEETIRCAFQALRAGYKGRGELRYWIAFSYYNNHSYALAAWNGILTLVATRLAGEYSRLAWSLVWNSLSVSLRRASRTG